ncbi:hypothetical protein [Microbacterium sp. EST19A]|uniref:hypothetical protein n=1 Tax=Microbacterium sp. EST19A TaxID=2862681 RepID=UPI001CBDFEDD|nr:hypothetical protein [Microbacterium sp. EST19A]
MSTSDQPDHGPLTRKQLREIRLTGSTPVITPEEAAAAAEAAPPAPPLPRPATPIEIPPAPVVDDVAADADTADAGAPLTRRQVREQERIKTASVSVVDEDAPEAEQPVEAAEIQAPVAETPAEATVVEEPVVAEPVVEAPAQVAPEQSSALVSGDPDFATPASTAPDDTAGDDDDVDDEIVVEPVRAAEAADSVGVVPLEVTDEPAETTDDVAAVFGLSDESNDLAVTDDDDDDDVLADVADADDDDVVADPRPTVNSAFGEGLLTDSPEPHAPFRPSFDELLTVGDSTGSQHSAPNALIFTPSPGEGSLSGPVASTGEILVTGSYELPRGLGSQGHAHGTTDGKDVDAVLIDGELAPASSPTPIAASAAVSTIKPAGEIIRPPAPEKGNRLLLILAIVAGGLALAVGTAVIVAFSTNVF